MFDKFYNWFQLYRKKVVYGKQLHINGKIAVHGNGKITIGDGVTFQTSPFVNPVAGGQRTHLRTERGGGTANRQQCGNQPQCNYCV